MLVRRWEKRNRSNFYWEKLLMRVSMGVLGHFEIQRLDGAEKSLTDILLILLVSKI